MKITTINDAVKEAKEFIKRAEELKKNDPSASGYFYGSKESGALRRSSMELTRALSAMRRPM